MAITQYRLVRIPMKQIDAVMANYLAEGFQPFGQPFAIALYPDEVAQVIIKGVPDGGGGGPVVITVADISDASVIGSALMKAASSTAARTAIGAGTSNLAVGAAATDAKPGNYAPNAAAISDASATGRAVLTAADAAAARTAIGAGVPYTYTLPNAASAARGGVLQAVAQANSAAADTPGLVADFNDLLAKLRTAGVVAP